MPVPERLPWQDLDTNCLYCAMHHPRSIAQIGPVVKHNAARQIGRYIDATYSPVDKQRQNAKKRTSFVMEEQHFESGKIRKVRSNEIAEFRNHLLRLDKQGRRLRFAHSVSDEFIENYAAEMTEMGSVIYGYFTETGIHATAELKKLGETWGHEAEAAFSVESSTQGHGIGTELMGRVITAARNRGVSQIYMSCLAENTRMQAIARKYDAELRFESGEVVGEIIPDGPNYFSILSEAMEDRTSYMLAVLNLQKRLMKVA